MTAPILDKYATGSPRFVHLKVHSAYSLLEGALPIRKLAKLAAEHAMPAVALTDTNNLFGALEFSDKVAAAGVQPIIGVLARRRFRGAQGRDDHQPGMPPARAEPRRDGLIALLAMNEAGYANLMKLVSLALSRARGRRGAAHRRSRSLQPHGEGLIALTGGPEGPIDGALRDGQNPKAEERLLQAQEDVRRPALRRDPAPRPRRPRSRSSRSCSSWPTSSRSADRRHQRSAISPRPTTTRRTTRCCASPKAATSSRTIAGG